MKCQGCGQFHTEHTSLCTCDPLTRLAREVDVLKQQVASLEHITRMQAVLIEGLSLQLGHQRKTIAEHSGRIDLVQVQSDRQDEELTAQLGQLQNLDELLRKQSRPLL
jgi:hypothetical protein